MGYEVKQIETDSDGNWMAGGQPSKFISILGMMYWCVDTMTTVGYGDYYPEGTGKIADCIAILIGLLVIVPAIIIGGNFDELTISKSFPNADLATKKMFPYVYHELLYEIKDLFCKK